MMKMLEDPDKTGNQIAEIFNVSNAFVSRLKRKVEVTSVPA